MALSSVVPVKPIRIVMATLDAKAVAQLLREFAGRSSLRGGNPYRAKAYARAADSLAALVVPLEQIIAEDGSRKSRASARPLPISSPSCSAQGRIQALRRCARKCRQVCWKCSPCRACGLTRCSSFIKTLGITSLAGLEQAARADRIKGVKGTRSVRCRQRFCKASPSRAVAKAVCTCTGRQMLLENARASLRQAHPELKRVTFAGDLRRGCELVADLALVAEAPALDERPHNARVGRGTYGPPDRQVALRRHAAFRDRLTTAYRRTARTRGSQRLDSGSCWTPECARR